MARPTLHDTDLLLDAVVNLVLEAGVGAATVEAVTQATGAPSGTVYNRFGNRDGMLKAAWERSARRSQDRFLAAISSADSPREAILAAGLSVVDFTRSNFDDARLLISVRRIDLFPADGEAEALNAPIAAAIRDLARALCGRATSGAIEAVAFASLNLPQGAVRRYLVAGERPPRSLTPLLTAAINGVLDTIERKNDER